MRSARRDFERSPAGPLFIIIIFGTALLPLVVSVTAAGPRRPQSPVPGPNLENTLRPVLDRAAEYCDKLNRSVLNFVCRERIEEWFRPSAQPASTFHRTRRIFLGPREIHHYVYDYQLIHDRGGFITERRVLLKEDGKDVRVPDAPLKTRISWYTKVVLGPPGLLSRESQAEHDYRIVRQEKVHGEDAWVVEAVPKPGLHPQHLFGTIWLRKKDAGILKVEWNPVSIDKYELVEKTAKFLGLKPFLLVMSEYAFEKNGIRFPSRYTLRETYRRGPSGAPYEISEISVIYDQYKFFTVETEVKY